MAKHTQAHFSKTFTAGLPPAMKEREREKMEYYMGAKLIEVGVNPKSVIYRWTVEPKGNKEVWTCSAYWDDSKERILREEQGA